ncbi:Kunitz family serine protease inhibitor, partial [Staphylococcus warneri]|uniref:Uncharacterized protein n=1 Tax=Staphylococcus warneri TaxID=1292 RepID=A0AB36BKU7_STAWA|nr:hypothetical protein [Staphylococcus warneri]
MLGSSNENNETCEADVLQSPFDLDPGTPFTFTPVDNEDVIKLGYPVAIQSPTENPCKYGSTVWKLSSRNEVPAEIITTGGIINTPLSCLRITRPRAPAFPALDTYTLESCPFMCGVGGIKICKPIGTYTSNYQRHLSPNAEWPFEFILIKASESAVITAVV